MDLRSLAPDELCRRFDSDILFDAHSLALRVDRSDATRELLSRGREVAPAIIAHLRKHAVCDKYEIDLRKAWGAILHRLVTRAVGDECGQAAETYEDTEVWISWAEKHLNLTSA